MQSVWTVETPIETTLVAERRTRYPSKGSRGPRTLQPVCPARRCRRHHHHQPAICYALTRYTHTSRGISVGDPSIKTTASPLPSFLFLSQTSSSLSIFPRPSFYLPKISSLHLHRPLSSPRSSCRCSSCSVIFRLI